MRYQPIVKAELILTILYYTILYYTHFTVRISNLFTIILLNNSWAISSLFLIPINTLSDLLVSEKG